MLLSQSRLEEAETSFHRAYELVVKFPEDTPVGRQYRWQMNLLELRRRVMNGAPSDCEAQLLQRFTRAASLRYIAENGNCLYIAKEAVKSLEEL